MSNDVDIQTVEVTSVDQESIEMEHQAKLAAMVLSKAYPEHLWMVGWAPGMTLVIKNGAMDARYGFTVDYARAFSASDLEHTIKMAGGELLERMGMERGRWNGEFANRVEGQEEHGPNRSH